MIDCLVDEMRNEAVQIQFNNNDKRNLNSYSEIDNVISFIYHGIDSRFRQEFHLIMVTRATPCMGVGAILKAQISDIRRS